MVDWKNYGVVPPLLVRGDGKGNQQSSEGPVAVLIESQASPSLTESHLAFS